MVTGGTGLVGNALVSTLETAGYDDVLATGRAPVDLTEWHPTLELLSDYRPDVVFHLAARVYGILGNVENPSRAFIDNIRINTNVIEAARQVGVRKVVAMGSTAIYSDIVELPMSETDVWSGRPHQSEGPYAHAKRSMLAQLETYAEHDGMEFAYCVATNLYGPHDRFDERWGHVIPSLVSKVYTAKKTGSPLKVWGSGSPTRDFLYSIDAANALVRIGECATGVVNVAVGESHSIRATVETLADVADFDGEIAWDVSKPDGQRERRYNVTRLRDLGFVPQWSLRDGLKATFEWFEANVQTARR